MVRTQIYLTETEHKHLASLARSSGKKQSELIREAVDKLIEQTSSERRKRAFKQVAGLWKDRADLPDFGKLRKEWERK